MKRLHVGVERFFRGQQRAVAAAFDEGHARDHRIAREGIERKHERPADEAVDHEAVLVGIDVGIARVRNDEVQAVGCDRAVQQVVRRPRVRRARLPVGIAERAPDALFEARRQAVVGQQTASRLAPRIVGELLCRNRVAQRIAGDCGGDGGAALQERAAVEQPVSRHGLFMYPCLRSMPRHVTSTCTAAGVPDAFRPFVLPCQAVGVIGAVD